MPSLYEIEKSFCTLLLDGSARQIFLARQNETKKGNAPSGKEPGSNASAANVDFDADGVRLYAKLTNYAYHEVLPSVYPGCMHLIGDEWGDVVNDYLEKFPPKHYNLNQSAREFPQYLAKFGQKFLKKFPFIVELADYEWIELEVMEDPRPIVDGDYEGLTSAEQFESLGPVVNPTLVIRSYNYDIATIVDQLAADEEVDSPEAKVDIAVFRHPESNLCKFIELGPAAKDVIGAAWKDSSGCVVSYKDLLALVVAQSADPNQAVLQFLELVETLQSLKLFLGSKTIA